MLTGEFRTGWRDLAAATIGLGFGIPGYTAVSSLFFQAVRSQFGWSSAATAGALVALPLTALALPVVGRLVDRFGVRRVTGISVLCLALGFLWLSLLRGGLWEYYAAIVVLNLLGCGTGPVAYTRLVAARFHVSRGAALAIAQFGIALFAAMLPPLLSGVIATHGWRSAYLMLAAFAIAGGAVAQILMRSGPIRDRANETGTGPGTSTGMDVSAAIRQPTFWSLATAIFLVSAASLGLVTQFQPLLIARGIAPSAGGWLLSVLAVSVMTSRIAIGWLLDRGRPEWWAAATIMVAATGAVVLHYAGANMTLLVVAVLLFGTSIGAELDLMGFFCARLFGLRHYSALYGLLGMAFYLGMAGGGIGYGVIRDRSGSYEPAVIASAVVFTISAILFAMLRRVGGGARSVR